MPFEPACFESTVTVAIARLRQAVSITGRFSALGLRCSPDDFGSGISSFGFLKQLPVDDVNIGGASVRDPIADAVDEAMVSAVRHVVANAMGLKTAAELAEDDEAVACPKQPGVDYAQGCGVHRPEPIGHLVCGQA